VKKFSHRKIGKLKPKAIVDEKPEPNKNCKPV